MKKQYIVPEICAYEVKMQNMLALSKTDESSNGTGGLAPKMEYDFGMNDDQDNQ